MESTSNVVPSSGQTTPSPSDLHVLLVHQGGVVVSMFAKKLYVCLHKVAMAPSNMMDQVLRIVREKVCLCEGIICEEASSAAPADNDLLQTIMNLASELHIHFEVVSQDHSLARIWSGTSDACVYMSRGDMVYAVQMRRRANQMMMESQRSSSSVAIGSSQVDRANNNNNEITAAASDEGVRRNYICSDQQLAEATGSDSSTPPTKKQRCVWTPQLHGVFEEAFNELQASMPRSAVPKKILECMKRKKNIPDWINRENIASHLQKYRKSIAKQQSQPTTMQQGGLLTDIPTSSRSISNTTTKTGVAPVMPSCRSDPAICNNMSQLNISAGLDHSALGIGYNLTRSSTMDLMHLKDEDPYQMSQGLGRDITSASGLGEVDWSNLLMSQLNGYEHQYSDDEVLTSPVINRFEHHCPNHDSMFGRPAVGSLSFIANDQHNNGAIGFGQQCPNPGKVGLVYQGSSFIANVQHNRGTGFRQQCLNPDSVGLANQYGSSFIANDQHNRGTGFRLRCPSPDSVGLVNQYGSSFIANDQTYNPRYVPIGNAGFDLGQQQPNQNYNSEVQSYSAIPNVAQQRGSTIIQNYKAEAHSNSFLPNVAQQGGSTIIQNYNTEVQINSVPPNAVGSTRFTNTVPPKPI